MAQLFLSFTNVVWPRRSDVFGDLEPFLTQLLSDIPGGSIRTIQNNDKPRWRRGIGVLVLLASCKGSTPGRRHYATIKYC